MNLIYDKKIKELLCSKCRGIAVWTKDGLQCTEKDCGYFYTTFAKDKKVNIFQQELNFG